MLAAARPEAPVFTARIRADGIRDEGGSPMTTASLASRRTLAVCGIANPSGFATSLADLDVVPEETIAFRDHQRYGPRELARIRRAAEETGASWIVTTEKDAVKLWGRLPLPVVAVRLAVEIVEPGFFPFLATRVALAHRCRQAG